MPRRRIDKSSPSDHTPITIRILKPIQFEAYGQIAYALELTISTIGRSNLTIGTVDRSNLTIGTIPQVAGIRRKVDPNHRKKDMA